MNEEETFNDFFGRVIEVANDMRNCRDQMNDVKIVDKVLRNLTKNFNYIVCSIEESKEVDTLLVYVMQRSLLVHEQKLSKRQTKNGQASKAHYDDGRGKNKGIFQGRIEGLGARWNRENVECYKCHEWVDFKNEVLEWNKQAHKSIITYGDMKEEVLLMACIESTEEEFQIVPLPSQDTNAWTKRKLGGL
ncbi:unnamed protein product [Linum trigynum]|uniref:Uncharacterized protein n=1 Tax=Linum trigynum TaxID=586398 RepID=A0AAV2CEX4_9ROSI